MSMEGQTPDQARNEALQRAKDRACEEAFGTDVLSAFLRQQSELVRNGKIEEANDSVVKFIRKMTGARVLRYTVINEYTENMARAGAKPRLDYIVIIDALVIKARGNPDPDFALVLSGVRDSYRHDEKLSLDITTTKNCYVNVFCLDTEGYVFHVFPNLLEKDNSFRADAKRTVPGSSLYSLRVRLPENKRVASETLLVVATKDSSSFRLGAPFRLSIGYAEMRRAILEELVGWILQIPRDRIAEAAESYVIRR